MPTLDFKGKSIVYSHHLGVPFRDLKIDKTKSFPKNNKPSLDDNLIIHGDNLHALKALMPRYAGKIKCIYIDPPYNTGNEGWQYNDNVNSPVIKEWLSKEVRVDDLEKHDKWLCMMWPRLQLLKELLSDDGVIFISIDDNEQANLKKICDEIFGEQNLVSEFVVIRAEGGGLAKQMVKGHDYVLTYAKFIDQFEPLKRKKDIRGKVVNKEGIIYWLEEDWLRKEFGKYGICYYEEILKYKDKNKKKEIDEGLKSGKYELVRKDKNHIVARYRRLDEDGSKFYSILKHLNSKGVNTVNNLGIRFDYPKPVSLVSELILGATFFNKDKNSIILDSFAGSGTTAHAVLDLNKQDGGNRKFILIECEDYADKVTAERVCRVIKGVPKAKDETLQKGLGGSFTYCTLDEEISEESLLKGKSLPSYETLAKYVFYTATGQTIDKIIKNQNYFIGKVDKDTAFFVIYEPDKKFLQSNDSALHLDRKRKILKVMDQKQCKKAIVFATTHYFDSGSELKSEGITFCGLPFAIHQIVGS